MIMVVEDMAVAEDIMVVVVEDVMAAVTTTIVDHVNLPIDSPPKLKVLIHNMP
jgi:hypothetical protein